MILLQVEVIGGEGTATTLLFSEEDAGSHVTMVPAQEVRPELGWSIKGCFYERRKPLASTEQRMR